MIQLNYLNKATTLSSVKQKNTIKSYVNEATRVSENYANNVNKNLSTLNIKIRDFNEEILNEQFNDVEVEQNSKDIVCFLSKINIRELELNNKTNIDLNMILTQEEIKKYFENNLKFLMKKLNMEEENIVYCVVHRDEDNLHMHTMFTQRKINEKMSNSEIIKNKNLRIIKTLKTRCARQLKKFEIDTKNFHKIDKKVNDKIAFCKLFDLQNFDVIKNFDKYKDFENFYIEKNYKKQSEKMIDKVNKKERTKKYYYDQSCNKLINFFKDDVHQQFVDFISKTDEFTKFKNIAEQILDDKIEVVKTLENSNYKNAENLKDLRDKINYRKKQLIEKFNNKQMNQSEFDELLQMNLKELEIKRKSEMTFEEYQKEYLKTQEIIRDGNFSINDNAVEKLKSLDANLNNFLKNLDKNTRAAFKSTFNDLKTVLSKDIEKLKVKKQELENENTLLNQNINTARLELNMINVNEKQKLEIELKQLKKNHLAKKQELLNNQKTEIENLKEQVRQKVSLSDKEIKEIEDEVKEELILNRYNEIKKNKDFVINDFPFQFNKNLYRKFEFETFDRIDNAVEIFENNDIEDSEITLLKGLESQEDEDNNKVFDILNYAEDYSYYNYEYDEKNECLSNMEKILNKLKKKFKIFKKVITNTIKKIKKNTKDFINSR